MEVLPHEIPQITEEEAQETAKLSHDSMVTVRLSETQTLPALTLVTTALTVAEEEDTPDTQVETPDLVFEDTDQPCIPESSRMNVGQSPTDETAKRDSDGTDPSEDGEVNWVELEKTEEQQPRDQDTEDSTTLLLARLEQENNLLVTNPKAGLTRVTIAESGRTRSQSRPPSMHQLKKMVNGPTPAALRYSLLPAPPMTDLEFYTALVQDYTRTAQRLPTLLSKKIRSGVPPPLRGVVWQSMSGARDRLLEDQFDRLCGESSPYEGIIGKDLGRSFPGVEMFRDPEGDGQRMLGRVLKCFSLYDHKIGYCQGLGFLVGPLLMHMGDRQAFCVLVRLMEHYDLRSCFLPDLSGLHVRIYQFRELLKKHLPTLNAHLECLQIEPAYVSQWFLSFFAVTCPLPMLFRIYDVIFAEGASETIMRVALAVMRKNQDKILACTEFEDVMQLLLSRGLWDCYHMNADDFVNDFASLTSIVTNETLQILEASFKESQASNAAISEIGSVAARFLGRLWAGSNSSTRSTNLSPNLAAPSRPSSLLRRSASKQSIASTLNSMEGGGDSILSSTSTAATSVSRDSSNTDGSSTRGQSTMFGNPAVSNMGPSSNNHKNLHGQIEDLLIALSEMQRDHAILATQLQQEREEREEDRYAVRTLLDGLRKKSSSETVKSTGSDASLATLTPTALVDEEIVDGEETAANSPKPPSLESASAKMNEDLKVSTDLDVTQAELSRLLDNVEERFIVSDNRRSLMLQTKSQLRDEVAQSKEQLINAVSKCQDLNRRLNDAEQELVCLRDQMKEGHTHIRNAHQEKQRLEKLVLDLKSKRGLMTPDTPSPTESEWPKRASVHGGLRELKLGRANSTRSQPPTFSKRTSSLNMQGLTGKENEIPINSAEPSPTSPAADVDALVLELVRAKTAEAMAKEEAEEAKAKLESLRKLLDMSSAESNTQKQNPSPPTMERSLTLGGLTSYMSRTSEPKAVTPPAPVSATAASGGFWGGWSKRSVSGGERGSLQDKL